MPEFDSKTWELLKAMLLMAVLLVIVALGIQLITIYRRRLTTRSSDSKAEQAELFREAYEAGEIDTNEYRQIQDALDRGQAPPALGIARLPEQSSASSPQLVEQTGTDPADGEAPSSPDPTHEGGTEAPDLPRSG
ncbi:hypothetical protein [Tautonia marina]|uniref:hypothetical protein n=1 Tax=Tautonia marina TaxID=2653855 RepID=UPI00126108F8|nr:hypothetical protein [Tautonia marina]